MKPIVGNWAEFHVITDPRDNIIIIIIIIITQCIKGKIGLSLHPTIKPFMVFWFSNLAKIILFRQEFAFFQNHFCWMVCENHPSKPFLVFRLQILIETRTGFFEWFDKL